MGARTFSLEETADELGFHVSTLYRHRDGDRIVFDDGQELRLVRLGRRIRVPATEISRLLGETQVAS